MGVFDIFKRGVDMPKTAQQRKDESIKILKKDAQFAHLQRSCALARSVMRALWAKKIWRGQRAF